MTPVLPSLPLEVGPFKSSYGIWGSAVSSPTAGSGAQSQPKSNLVHFNFKMTSCGNNFNYFAENQLTKFSAGDARDFSDA